MYLGFTGFEKDYPDTLVIMSKKKPKGKELTDDAKVWNRIISSFRVLVKHAIGGVKRFGTVSDKFRNRKDGFDDKVMLISRGLWNYPSVVLLNRGCGTKVERMILVEGLFRNKSHDGKRHFVTMTVRDGIVVLIQHIPDRNFKMIRYYGAYSRGTKGRYSEYFRELYKTIDIR